VGRNKGRFRNTRGRQLCVVSPSHHDVCFVSFTTQFLLQTGAGTRTHPFVELFCLPKSTHRTMLALGLVRASSPCSACTRSTSSRLSSRFRILLPGLLWVSDAQYGMGFAISNTRMDGRDYTGVSVRTSPGTPVAGDCTFSCQSILLALTGDTHLDFDFSYNYLKRKATDGDPSTKLSASQYLLYSAEASPALSHPLSFAVSNVDPHRRRDCHAHKPDMGSESPDVHHPAR
jgi:hypothetical protein